MVLMALSAWWFAILWTYTEAFPRPFDDWKNTLFYVGAGVFAIYNLTKRNFASPHSRILLPLIAIYFATAIVSLITAPTAQHEGILELVRLILWLGAAWVFTQLSSRHWLWLMRFTIISAAAIATLSWFQSRGAAIWPYSGHFLPPIGHVTYYGDFMALSLVMAMGLLFYEHERFFTLKHFGWLASMFLIDIGLATAATRASLIGIAVAFLLASIGLGYRTRSFRTAAIIIMIGALNFIVIFAPSIKSTRGAPVIERLQQLATITPETIETATSGRWHSYISSFKIVKQRPITGWGIGSFRFVYPEFAHRDSHDELVSSSVWYMHPHNEILHQAVEVGCLGAAVWIIGFGYLLYVGGRVLRHGEHDENEVLLITAMCGLVAAFVSWQFSTNYLFPVSRLMTALFAGMVWKMSSPDSATLSNSPHPPLILGGGVFVIALATLFMLANQVSIYCVQKEQTSRNPHTQWEWATWAVRLAPGAFDPLYIRASLALQTLPPAQAASDVEALYKHYPYVPAVLHMMGYLRTQQGNFPEARQFLQHAFANDPANTAAKQLLDQLPPAH